VENKTAGMSNFDLSRFICLNQDFSHQINLKNPDSDRNRNTKKVVLFAARKEK
jgi:hypothetical protein